MSAATDKGSGISTLDASNLAYQVERVRINIPHLHGEKNLLEEVNSKKAIPQNLSYVDDFYDSGTVFQVDRTDVCSVY